MGYAGDLRLMLKGTFTTLEPTFTIGGAPTLAVRGLNALHQLRRKQYSHTWNDKRDSEIAKDIATLVDKDLGKNHKRFPVPVVIDPQALAREETLPIRRAEKPVRHRLSAVTRASPRLRGLSARSRPDVDQSGRAKAASVFRAVGRAHAWSAERRIPTAVGRARSRNSSRH